MRPGTAIVRWSLVGATTAVILLVAQASAVGGWEGLLQVGEASSLRPIIEAELGEIPLSPGPGHDGQIYYAIGLDLSRDTVPQLLDHAGYRYRRILYPALASGFGLLEGHALLAGMIGVTIASTAVASAAAAAISVRLGRSDRWALAVILNPGVWLGVRLLTADIMTLALMIGGLFYMTGSTIRASGAFALSGLAKDVYLITPIGLICGRRRRLRLALLPLITLIAWMILLTMTVGEGFAPRGNLSWPFVGMLEGASNWSSLDLQEVFYLVFALTSVVAGLVYGAVRRGWLRWPILGWSALAIVSSEWVWDLGNNAARAFLPIAVLLALSIGQTDPHTATAGDASEASRGIE